MVGHDTASDPSALGALGAGDQLLPSHVNALSERSTDRQKLLSGHDRKKPAAVLPVVHVPPLKVAVILSSPTATQNPVAGHDTEK